MSISEVFMRLFVIIALAFLWSLPTAAKIFDTDFNNADTNRDKYISQTEFLKFQKRTMYKQNLQVFASIDTNKDGKISRKEFAALSQSIPQSVSGDTQWRQKFDSIDTDKNGYLSRNELSNFRNQMLLSDNAELFSALDVNQDKRISQTEFQNFIERIKQVK